MDDIEDKRAIQSLADIIARMGDSSPHEIATAIFCWLPTHLKHEKSRNRCRQKAAEDKIRTSEWVRVPTEPRIIEILMYHDDTSPELTAQRIIAALKEPELTVKEIVGIPTPPQS